MKVYVLDCGREELDKNTLVMGSSIGTVQNPTPPNIWTWVPVWSVLIDHPLLGYILFDAAVHPDAMNGWWEAEYLKKDPYIAGPDSTLPARLDQLGIKPEDIKTIVLSHMHNDHMGCVSLFKNATVYVHNDELKHAMKHYMTRKDYFPYCFNDIQGAIDAKLDWITLDKEDGFLISLSEDVQIVNFGSGHAHGMLGLLLKTKKSAPKLLIADVLYSMENAGPPVRLPGIVYDSLGYVRSIKAYQKLAKETGAEVWYGHDQVQWGSLKKSTEGYYE